MIKPASLCFLLLLLLFSQCQEDELDLRGTAPTIGFSFFKDGEVVRLDSVFYIGTDSTSVFLDTLQSYRLPLNYRDEASSFRFYVQSIESEVTLYYNLVLYENVNRIQYDAFLEAASKVNIDSISVVCQDTLNCNTNNANIYLYY